MYHPVARKITCLIGEMIAVDCQPFSIVEDDGFVNLVNKLQPCYQMPSRCSRKYFSTTLILHLFEKCKEIAEIIILC